MRKHRFARFIAVNLFVILIGVSIVWFFVDRLFLSPLFSILAALADIAGIRFILYRLVRVARKN